MFKIRKRYERKKTGNQIKQKLKFSGVCVPLKRCTPTALAVARKQWGTGKHVPLKRYMLTALAVALRKKKSSSLCSHRSSSEFHRQSGELPECSLLHVFSPLERWSLTA